MGRRALISSWLDLFLVLGSLVATGHAKYVPLLQPGFFFDYNIQGQPVPIPITEQCETIHVKWGPQGAQGPNPVAPYSMVVYTSTFITPFTIAAGEGLSFDWQVPFAPGTQYQICMWDKNGVPGGCQAMYTVVQNSTVANPSCQNVTFPTLLQVEATQAVPAGPMSQFGFINQCTDLFVTPKSGKPPFTLTVAPALHPPYNITSNSMGTIDWTVSLSWSFPFFLSLVSSDGQMWSNGPLHAGGFGPSDCLAPGTIPSSRAHSIAVGAGLGGAFAAAIFGALVTLVYLRGWWRKLPLTPGKDEEKFGRIDAVGSHPDTIARPFPSRTRPLSWTTVDDVRSSQIISPAAIRSPAVRSSSLYISPPVRSSSQMISPSQQLISPSQQVVSPSQQVISPLPRSRTYLLHQDAGRAPITVITDSAEVVELPPRYRRDSDIVPLPPVREKTEPLPRREPVRASSTVSAPLPQ